MLTHQDLTERVIGLAIAVHKELGPGLLESVYETCLAFELKGGGNSVPPAGRDSDCVSWHSSAHRLSGRSADRSGCDRGNQGRRTACAGA